MSKVKILLFVMALPLLSFTTLHKYYVSLTEIDFVKEEKSVQIISRIFVDDFETVLRNRYDEGLTLLVENEEEEIDYYIERYLQDRFKVFINGNSNEFNFIGKEYEDDIMLCYLEIQNIEEISSIQVENRLLFDQFPDQKNIVRFKINSVNKSFLLIKENDKGVLNF